MRSNVFVVQFNSIVFEEAASSTDQSALVVKEVTLDKVKDGDSLEVHPKIVKHLKKHQGKVRFALYSNVEIRRKGTISEEQVNIQTVP